MRNLTIRILPLVALLTGLAACSDTSSLTHESAPPAPEASAIAIQDDYVATPAGWYHRSCVHEIEAGARVGQDGIVTRKNGSAYKIARCAYPVRVSKNGPVKTPTITGWLEYASRAQPSGSWYKQINANWTVPLPPLGPVVGSSQVYFTFPGLQSTFIIQPVLQWGISAAGGGQAWMLASWHCHSSLGCTHSPLKTTAAGHALSGSVVATNCAGGNCTWTITSRDVTSNTSTVLTVTDTYNYWWGVGGSVEVYGLTSCDQFPIRGVFYTNIALYDQNGVLLSPVWDRSVQSNPNPSCGFSVGSAPTTVSLFHNPASVTANGGFSASCSGICNGAWLTYISASGNQITLRDNFGHSGVLTLTGATASGTFTASCGTLCSNSWIGSITPSGGNAITIQDNGGHAGTITFTGATTSGPGLSASCGPTCSNAWIGSVTGYGANGFVITDNGGNRGYVRFN